MSFPARTYIPIHKSNAITMLEDTIFLEVDGVIPNWNTYSFSIRVVTLGTNTVVFRLADACSPAEAINRLRETSPDRNLEGTEVKHEPTGVTALTVKEEDLPETIEGETVLTVKEEDLPDTVATHTQDLTANISPQSCTCIPMARLMISKENRNPNLPRDLLHYRLRMKRAASMEPLEQGVTTKTTKKCRSL
ncbi:hypothetical protein PAXRUDRAFT_158922 [Paxillus rubicundulus Ve08.2h10]|uniref:Uncharacterized protein n=1 Tax=Paxillus rubicundulus Ve08.2h10 TaxID=930991 RepID=A0A0D0DNT6_9AGAM|nr:hypothetical protein PAXRUDRAFT_158922 [Paxillus rubicundulus Ve08.2h10]